jgi:DNA-binding NarL/FixJ family response regulator
MRTIQTIEPLLVGKAAGRRTRHAVRPLSPTPSRTMPAKPSSSFRDDDRSGAVRLLLAASDAVTRGPVGLLLRAHDGIEVVGAAATDAETLRLARRTRPDVVLIESANGLHVLATARRLLAERDLAGTEVLLFGRFDRDEEVLAALRSGIGGLVDKNATPEELLRAVRMSASGAAFVIPRNRLGSAPAIRPDHDEE